MKKTVRTAINLYPKPFWLNAGWYAGDPFKLFSVEIGETLTDYHTGKIDQICFLHLQILHLVIAFGVQNY